MTGRVTDAATRVADRARPSSLRGSPGVGAGRDFFRAGDGAFLYLLSPMRKLLMPALLSLVACTSAKDATREEVPASASSGARTAAADSAPAQEGPSRMAYPATRSEAVVDTLHGQQVADPYRWLEDEKSPRSRPG